MSWNNLGEQDETVCLGNFVQQSQIGSLELTLVDFVRHLIAQAAGDECRKFWRRQTYFLALLR